MFNTPILLITFNRPNHTRRVLTRILESQPQDLYVFQDGARDGNANDAAKCAEVREVISTFTLTFPNTKVHTSYSRVNLGCGKGPMTAISWFFDHVEQGIVMEDDCLAHPDFFPYCEELLNRYKNDERVGFINSTLYNDLWQCKDSYGFSRYMVTGAWASWRRVWKDFDLDLHTFNAKKFYFKTFRLTGNLAEALWWFQKVKAIQRDKSKKSYWDYQMQILLFDKKYITIHPCVNMISNIGFDAEGTHTLEDDGCGNRPVYPIYPLNHPNEIIIDKKEDSRCWAKAKSEGLLVDLWNQICGITKVYLKRILK